MTVMALPLTGASSTCVDDWETIDWSRVKQHVERLQIRIAKATREGRQGKVKSLQWLLTHSFYAKLLAVKRVTQNRGRFTPGVDKIIWKTPEQKKQAVRSLQRGAIKPSLCVALLSPKGMVSHVRSEYPQ